jgi:hypothetical protein
VASRHEPKIRRTGSALSSAGRVRINVGGYGESDAGQTGRSSRNTRYAFAASGTRPSTTTRA